VNGLFEALGQIAALSNAEQMADLQRYEARTSQYAFLPPEPVIDWDGMRARLEAAQRDIEEALRKIQNGGV
jgi:hypothetical protein